MTLIQLEYVITVAKYKNFTIAADKSFVTQPTLSMQIQKLERELDVEIFDRTTHPIKITTIGEKIIEHAKSILAEAKRMNQLVDEEKGSLKGSINIGIIPTVLPTLIPLIYKNFKNKYGNLHLKIQELKTDEIINKLKDGTIDFGIAVTPLINDNIVELPMYYEPLVAFIPQGHPLSKLSTIKEQDLDIKSILILEEGHCFRNNVLNICKSANIINREMDLDSGSFFTLIKLAKDGFGMTLLPLLHAEELSNEDKKYVKNFTSPAPTREVSLLYHQAQIRTSFAKDFIELVKSIIRGKLFLESSNVTLPRIKLA